MAQDMAGTEGSVTVKLNGDEAAQIRASLKLYIASKQRAYNAAEGELRPIYEAQLRRAVDLSRKFGG